MQTLHHKILTRAVAFSQKLLGEKKIYFLQVPMLKKVCEPINSGEKRYIKLFLFSKYVTQKNPMTSVLFVCEDCQRDGRSPRDIQGGRDQNRKDFQRNSQVLLSCYYY